MSKMWMEVICLHMWTRSDQIVAQEPDTDRAQMRIKVSSDIALAAM